MKNTGIARKIDPLGRIVIPKEIRDHLALTEDSRLDFWRDGSDLILRVNSQGCCFCKGHDELIDFKGKQVCRECVESNKEIIE